MKKCSRCKVDQPLSEFHKSSMHKDGHNPQCRTCFNAKRRESNKDNSKDLERSKRWYANNREHVRARQVEKKYGISYEKFLQLVEEQDNQCAICSKNMDGKREPAIDHDHDTGEVRQLLCANCNAAIGLLQDNADIIMKAAQYVEFHKKPKLRLIK